MTDIFLSEQEEYILDSLAKAWNTFMALDGDYHDDEVDRFRAKIHDLQNQIMARPTRRYMAKVQELRDEKASKPSAIQRVIKAVQEEDDGTLRAAIVQRNMKKRRSEISNVLEPYRGVFFGDKVISDFNFTTSKRVAK